jgi:REP element-mobilizing transposase RayT
MARNLRIYFPGAFYHVILRGNARRQLFFTSADRRFFYKLIQQGTERYCYRIYSFCLMSNHVHLAIQVSSIPLGKIMQNIAFRYASMLNWKQQSIGHVFQGRYKAILVDTDQYLLELIRYIHLNPIRAQIVTKLEDYPWSSHLAYLGCHHYDWLKVDDILQMFSTDKSRAVFLYQKFISTAYDALLDKRFNVAAVKNKTSTDPGFVNLPILGELENNLDKMQILTLDELVAIVCEYYSISLDQLRSSNKMRFRSNIRVMIAILAQEANIATLTKVATYLNRDVSAISRAMRLHGEDKEMQRELLRVRELCRMSKCQD